MLNQAGDTVWQSWFLSLVSESAVSEACSLLFQSFQLMWSRWPRTSSQLLRSSRAAMTLSSPPKPPERLWPIPLPSARRLISPPWTARSSRFVLLQFLQCQRFYFPTDLQKMLFKDVFFLILQHICNKVTHARCHICQTLCQSWYCELSVLCRVSLETALVRCDKGAFYLLIPSALSIWREASWSAILASSVTSRSSREERWLRYAHEQV